MNLNTNFQIYVAALYFAVMTLTSVGYGDITPQSESEYIGCIFLMLVSGIVWAYILGELLPGPAPAAAPTRTPASTPASTPTPSPIPILT